MLVFILTLKSSKLPNPVWPLNEAHSIRPSFKFFLKISKSTNHMIRFKLSNKPISLTPFFILLFFSHCCDKAPHRNNIKDERIVLCHSSSGISILHARKGMVLEEVPCMDLGRCTKRLIHVTPDHKAESLVQKQWPASHSS